MKDSTKNLILALLLIAAPFAYASYVYPSLPDTIPTHFNIKGEADAYGGKDSIFLGPGIMAVVGLFVFVLLSNIKSFDPKRYKVADDGLYKKFALFTVADRSGRGRPCKKQVRAVFELDGFAACGCDFTDGLD